MTDPSTSFEMVVHRMFETLARKFPIACASDEFFYFPQVKLSEPDWSIWDCFSKDFIKEFVCQLSVWEDELYLLASDESDINVQIDIALVRKLIRTLYEQLLEFRAWEFQPTFYLILVCIGVAEAMESNDPAARYERVRNLPAFLDQANQNLDHVPVLFQEIGLEMVADTRNYLSFLEKTLPELLQPALAALDRFEGAVKAVSTREDFLLPVKLFERILYFHINCNMEIQGIEQIIDQEIDEMRQVLADEVKSLFSSRMSPQSSSGSWLEVFESIPMPDVSKEGLIRFYDTEVKRLTKFCLDQGLVLPALVASCPVYVAPMPSYLSAIRTSSSYSMPPRYPPSGGVFYIINAYDPNEAQKRYHCEYRMLSAHETYPGHHLLDTSRWSLTRSCRRAVEQPIFYEGWACFAEEIMRLTGYFSDSYDRLLLAKRRLWRAIRGKVDIGLQTGAMDVSTAAKYLEETGMSKEQAISAARKYTLNPGYQLCYTLGLHRFMDLFNRYGHKGLQNFVKNLLGQGEINFLDLEKILKDMNN